MARNKPTKKIVLIGSAGVGKTAFSKALLNKGFDEKYSPTNVAEHWAKRTDFVVLEAWDISGQERFRSMINPYSRGADVFFLCFDLTNLETLDYFNDSIKDITNQSSEARFILIGTKCDCLTKEEQETARQTLLANDDFLNKYHIDTENDLLFTSAKDKVGVKDVLDRLDKLFPEEESNDRDYEPQQQSHRNCCFFSGGAATAVLAGTAEIATGTFLFLGFLATNPATLSVLALLTLVLIVGAYQHAQETNSRFSPS